MKKPILVSFLVLIVAITIKAQEIFDVVKANDLAKVKAMVEKDASLVHLKDAAGNTLLHIAAMNGSVPFAEYLLSKEANINAVNTQLNTPLHESILNKKDDISRVLIEKGCGLNIRDNLGRTPLHLAAQRNSKSIVELLIAKGADIESETDSKLTPLHYAVLMTDNYEIVEYLIEKGANVNPPDHFGKLPLNSAAYHRSRRMIDLLLDNNADFDTSGAHGINTLLSAAEKGSFRLFNAVTAKIGDDYFKNEEHQESIMRSALSGGSIEIVNSLLTKNIKINLSPDENGWTSLHFTASNKQPEMMGFLVNQGANINQRTRSGKSAYNIAEEKGHKELLDLILKLGGNSEPQKFPELTGPYMGQIPPGNEFKAFVPDIIFTRHCAVSISPDGKEIYWALDARIYMTKIENGKWIKPVVVSFSGSQEYGDDVPFITPDNKKMFFTSTRPLGPIAGKENIWYSERTASGWSEPKPVSPCVNALRIHWQVSVSNLGTLYFGGTKNGISGTYYSQIIDGEYSEPVILSAEGENISGICPYIAPDESYIIFATLVQRQVRLNISYKSKNAEWLKPIELPFSVYGPEAFVSPDGKYLFNRSNWISAKFIEEMRPKK